MPRKRSKSKRISAPAKIIGDPNQSYDKTENHSGPGRKDATVAFGNPEFPDKFHFFLRYPHNAKAGEGRKISSSWAEAYAAKAYLDFVIGDEEVNWTALNKFVTHQGVEVSCAAPTDKMEPNQLEIAMDYRPTKAEQAFVVPEKDRQSFLIMTRPYPDVEKPSPTGKAKMERRSANKPDGKYISVASIAEELGIQPRDARASLRRAKFEKPDWGWAFKAGSPELKQVTAIIKKGGR